MDISVHHLNHRMSVQVPASLPLGLVFVVGTVANAHDKTFDLVENGYHLHCQRTNRIDPDLVLVNGQRIRASGHLTFDEKYARYLLIARDIEQLVEPKIRKQSQSEMSELLKIVSKRADAGKIANGELPNWVKKLAPAEVRPTLELESEVEAGTPTEPVVLSDQMISVLSQAMDSEDDVELTPEFLVNLAEGAKTAALIEEEKMPANISTMYEQLPEPPPEPSDPAPTPAPSPKWGIEDTIITLLIVLLILVILVVVGIAVIPTLVSS